MSLGGSQTYLQNKIVEIFIPIDTKEGNNIPPSSPPSNGDSSLQAYTKLAT